MQRLFFAIFFAIFLRPTEQICPDSAGPFIVSILSALLFSLFHKRSWTRLQAAQVSKGEDKSRPIFDFPISSSCEDDLLKKACTPPRRMGRTSPPSVGPCRDSGQTRQREQRKRGAEAGHSRVVEACDQEPAGGTE